jgi:hypothetical protein
MSKNKLQCSVTGLWFNTTCASRKRMIEKEFGSEENLTKNYVCKRARKLLKQGKTVEEIQAMVTNGELTSKAEAPGTKAHKKVKKVKKKEANTETGTENTETVEAEPVKEETEEESDNSLFDTDDPDIKAFLQSMGS